MNITRTSIGVNLGMTEHKEPAEVTKWAPIACKQLWWRTHRTIRKPKIGGSWNEQKTSQDYMGRGRYYGGSDMFRARWYSTSTPESITSHKSEIAKGQALWCHLWSISWIGHKVGVQLSVHNSIIYYTKRTTGQKTNKGVRQNTAAWLLW